MLSCNKPRRYQSKITDDDGNEEQEICRLACLCQSRGVGYEVGYAFMDVNTANCSIGQVTGVHQLGSIMRLIEIHDPQMIIFPKEKNTNSLEEAIMDQFSNICYISIEKNRLDADSAMEIIKKTAIDGKSSGFEVVFSQQYYSLIATSGLYSYYNEKNVDGIHKLHKQIKYEIDSAGDKWMFIDFYSIRNLELIKSQSNNKKAVTLLKSLDFTNTAMGHRLLKSNILQPMTNTRSIEERRKFVSVLIQEHDDRSSIVKSLKNLNDIDTAIASLSTRKPKIFDFKKTLFMMLKNIFCILEGYLAVENISKNVENDRFKELKIFQDFEIRFNLIKQQNIFERILTYFDHEKLVDKRHKMSDYELCFLVKPQSNSLIDVARKALDELSHDIVEYCQMLTGIAYIALNRRFLDQLGFEHKVKFTNNNRYIISLPSSLSSTNTAIPSHLIRINNSSYTTIDLIKFNERVSEAMDEIIMISGEVIDVIANDLINHSRELYEISEWISLLDLLTCYALYSLEYGCVNVVHSDGQIEYLNSFNPLLLHKDASSTIPNSFTSDCDTKHFSVITGSNMAGKSTFIKQIAYLQILVQIGCFIPADRAIAPIFDRICTRIGSDDELEANASTFFVEMRDAKYIVDCADQGCLILIDELGRGTGTCEGLALTTAICEKLLDSKATILFATHFHSLLSYLITFPACQSIFLTHGKACTDTESIKANYAIELAESLNLPTELTDLAKENFKILTKNKRESDLNENSTLKAAGKRRVILKSALRVSKVVLNHKNGGDADSIRNELFVERERIIAQLSGLE